MKQSQLFGKVLKQAPKDEVSDSAKLLIRAGYIDKVMAGVYNYLPLGLRVLDKIKNIVREEMVAIDGQEILMPALQPKERWQKTGRWNTLDVLFKVIDSSKKEYALGPTHEEVVTPLAGQFIFSYKDLPLYVFQIQDKFRDEPRAKSGLLRGKEFSMKDLYSFHATEEDLNDYYEKVKKSYFKIFKRIGLGDLTYLTFASGGSFSKYSHEFQTLSKVGEDVIYVCPKCHVAINKEIIAEQKACPECGNDKLEEKNAIEVGNIFPLNTKFSDAFDLKYIDEAGKKHAVIMGCYGIGPSRIMGTLAEVFHDDKGIIWPESIAPYQMHLIGLNLENEAIKAKADVIYRDLMQKGIEVLYDDRIDKSAGEKFAEADLIGIPYRLVISEKTGNKIETKKRGEKEVKMLDLTQVVELIR